MHTKDDIYVYALSSTLTKVSSPATVGLYSSCQDQINMILRQIEVYTQQEALRIEQAYHGRSKPRSVKLSLSGLITLIGRLLFYKPVWTEKNQQHHNIRFIYVHFSAWHFAGSDLLWAGMAIRLFKAMEMKFGKLPLVLYRVAQYDEDEEVVKKIEIVEDGPNQWKSKMFCCCPLLFLTLLIPVVAVTILVLLAVFDFPKPEVEQRNITKSHVDVLEGIAIAALGVPAFSAVRFVFLMVKNFIINQDLNIRRGMDNERLSAKLGFMNEVRKEMWFLSSFIHFMEVFEKRRIRVVLNITNLDRCSPKKIVAVLDAINILLSDEESPFISILAVNPEVLVHKVNFADGCFSKEDRAYSLLNRIVTLAFTVPPLCDASKCNLFCSLTSHSNISEDINRKESKQRTRSSKKTPNESSMENAWTRKKSDIPLIDKTPAAFSVKEEEVENLVKSILTSQEGKLNSYMSDDAMSMRRVINSIRVTVILMKTSETELPLPNNIAAWVVLANQWPCRLSWIIQCAEDAEQRAEIDGTHVAVDDNSKTLWEIFSENQAELYVMSPQIEDLLEQDGDPEMFEMFLKVDFLFTVKDVKTFKQATVNLDHSIRKQLGQIRGTSRLNNLDWMSNVAPLPIRTIIKMNVEDVCQELEKLNFPSKYTDIVKSNNLSGLALVFGDADDLKSLLQMTFGEWTTFRLHFLGLPSHHRSQKRTMQWTYLHLQSQLSRFPHFVPQYHSSNLSLVFS
ncbi:hypothetical protein LDENG_00025400 [Lucifuga dentata]|nr:hypothetical protein LDENG_00025400 [Lucifuga dentata]